MVRYLDGTVVKGITHNFRPDQVIFHLFPHIPDDQGASVQVDMRAAKAVFFVRSFEGDPEHEERKAVDESDTTPGRQIQVEFADGEQLVGTVLDYRIAAPGFFVFPVDPGGNNQKIFVVNSAVRDVRFLS